MLIQASRPTLVGSGGSGSAGRAGVGSCGGGLGVSDSLGSLERSIIHTPLKTGLRRSECAASLNEAVGKGKSRMADALQTIDEVSARATAELAAVRSADQLEQWRIRYLGSNGEVKNLPQLIKTAPPDQKKLVGQKVNAVIDQLTQAKEKKESELASTI